MRDLCYGTARTLAKDIIDLINIAKQNESCDETHMVAMYLLGVFKEYDNEVLFRK